MSVQFGGLKSIHIIVQLSLLSISKHFSSDKTALRSHLMLTLHFCPHTTQPLAATTLLPISMNLTTLGTSHEWNCTVYALL